MKKIMTYLFVAFSALFLMSACSSDETTPTQSEAEDDVQIVTSIFPAYEITRAIAGEEANVSLMVGANEDAHHYEPSAQAVASVNEADVFIYSSDEMEFWVESLLAVVENDDLQVVELAEGLDLSVEDPHAEDTHDDHQDHDHEHDDHSHEGHDHGDVDPHFWLDPVAVNNQLSVIVEAFAVVNPGNQTIYEENAEDFSNKLNDLHQAYEEALGGASRREFVVQHQAFGHLANRYDLDQIAVGGLTTEVEPAPRELAGIVDFVREQDVPVIYYQSGGNSAIAETIAQETATGIAVLHDLESEPVSVSEEENGYLEAMAQNLEQLKKSID